jgi:hypothetical protein
MNRLKEWYRFLNPAFQNLFLDYPVDFKPRYGHGKPPHPELYQLINDSRSTYHELVGKALALKDWIWQIRDAAHETDSNRPVWNNGFLPGLDIIGIYTMLTEYRPGKYLEIGSGNSTKVAYKARHDQGLATEIISIDPQPRAEIDRLADRVIRRPFEAVDLPITEWLEPGDILFVDNSHRILPNSDAMVFFLEVLPRLKPGVIVHIHDVYLPYDYPQFMCDRFYSEQYGLAMFLLANPTRYETLLPNYFVSEDPGLTQLLAPIWEHPHLAGVERHGGSYWLRIAC